ncbi:hypothetical protein CHS0354_023949 [Potamilus streckersoni]|uniref:exoribonuclease II n=1 Tax=Potamilus streckersoni TaxID=2493646 RepID=A0AAE0VLL4_9BIVA|nr:hypothetical protein CHS0354_023949 [Potamilus streckersoni]
MNISTPSNIESFVIGLPELNNFSFVGKVLVITPTFNEIENISIFIARVRSINLGIEARLDILVVDDNSPDGTSDVAKSISEKFDNVFLITRSKREGLGTAYITGFKYAIEKGYDIVFEIDADLSHQPEMIPYFLESIQKADVVIGSRYLNHNANVVNWPIRRLILSKAASLYTRVITGMPINDPTSGFKCIRMRSKQKQQKVDIPKSNKGSRVERRGRSKRNSRSFGSRGNHDYGNETMIREFFLKEGRLSVSHKILRFLSEQQSGKAGFTSREIAERIGYTAVDLPGFWEVLHDLYDNDFLIKTIDRLYSISELGIFHFKQSIPTETVSQSTIPHSSSDEQLKIGDTVVCKLGMRREGHSKAKIVGSATEILIEQGFLNHAFDKDIVKVRINQLPTKGDPFYYGNITKIEERLFRQLIGRIEKKSEHEFRFLPDNPNFCYKFYVKPKSVKHVDVGSKIAFSEFSFAGNNIVYGSATTVLGQAGSPDVELEANLLQANIDITFSKSVTASANRIHHEITNEEIEKRLDLRGVDIFTIDPDDAKDFDDALSIHEKGDIYEIGVHIADVSHFVKENGIIDKEAAARATSVYLVDRVIPMLPSRLCEDLCSLVPHVDRLAYSVLFSIDKNAQVLDYKIAKTVIHSKHRFTYESAEDAIWNSDAPFHGHVSSLNTLAKQLYNKRIKEGALDFNTEEWKVKLDANGKPISTLLKQRLDAHRLVEEFMLLANKTVAKHMYKHFQTDDLDYPVIYRVHDLPTLDRIISFANFCKLSGFHLKLSNHRDKITANAESIQKLLDDVKSTPFEALIPDLMLRTMSKAIYSPNNIGHFGLGFPFYLHFTSPIRRYPDLMTHRLLFEYETLKINSQKISRSRLKKLKTLVSIICQHSSDAERNATEAERKSIAIKQVEYMKPRVGELFDGIISDVLDFGIFVKLTLVGIHGFIHIKDFPKDDYYNFEKRLFAFIGERTNRPFKVGQTVSVKITSVDELKMRINLSFAE